jgi:toxin YoeB
MRKIYFEPNAFEHIRYWSEVNNRLLQRIFQLIEETRREPFKGIGKPEPLKHTQGYWSRRINDEHRLVYKVTVEAIIVISCRFHYDN